MRDDDAGICRIYDAREEPGDFLDRLLRGGQTYALQPAANQRAQALQREGKVRAAFGACYGVDFVHDHTAGTRKHRAPRIAGQQ